MSPSNNSIPKSAAQWVIRHAKTGFDGLELETKGIPSLGPCDVLVKMRAASLNFRDLAILMGSYPFPAASGVVPTSDGAGEVVAVGPQVKYFKEGDRVVTLFNQGHQHGALDNLSIMTGLGGVLDGALREYGVFHEQGLVPLPKGLTFEEGATLPCAALTAWNALNGLKVLKPGQHVLVQGTGGVSVFALQFAKAAGAFVVATTSSAEKAELLKKHGADVVINYKETPSWGEEARKHTHNNAGFDRIVEVGGPYTLPQSLAAIKFEGIISMVGFVAQKQTQEDISLMQSLLRVCTVRGILVGSRDMMLEMDAAIEVNGIKPIVDKRTFGFKEAKDAYLYQWEQKHIGKVVIKINE
ncbi:GroES-like protein [Tuber magnatum]|uniref:GroES-like protein n=1 Tax=Tuber magnatum TaxID=42249 RepID=A0A317T220_9PEZI|nr:GroES-like protein [Tuber magnatum]